MALGKVSGWSDVAASSVQKQAIEKSDKSYLTSLTAAAAAAEPLSSKSLQIEIPFRLFKSTPTILENWNRHKWKILCSAMIVSWRGNNSDLFSLPPSEFTSDLFSQISKSLSIQMKLSPKVGLKCNSVTHLFSSILFLTNLSIELKQQTDLLNNGLSTFIFMSQS